ncbi:MAG: hypothetical protein F6K24_45390 [Okeania sp. SIO2D1]|nr:hypothetical protein [Okeania sp. SIO2D1]
MLLSYAAIAIALNKKSCVGANNSHYVYPITFFLSLQYLPHAMFCGAS